ncbi:hypothetical protein OG455_38640 [Kitasatospora sp. NBC_01287]|uniref:hypothetical protein n=1 Tax=Kitasatospora sp. NBC_01287 TaxID=2903573 RepID=UPI0022539E3D|nr:hypothetical protein [Kitasatospora sp. NBC_01287]MCX4751355.1 hypothetical protein [Kitasatospora sp. NBC_01287]
MRRGATALTGLALLPALLAALLTGCQSEGSMDHGEVYAFGTASIRVKAGQTFSLRQKLAVVPGSDDWQVIAPRPDPAVVAVVGTDLIKADSSHMGDGGEVYLVFKAVAKGSTEVQLENCLSCASYLRASYQQHGSYRVEVG